MVIFKGMVIKADEKYAKHSISLETRTQNWVVTTLAHILPYTYVVQTRIAFLGLVQNCTEGSRLVGFGFVGTEEDLIYGVAPSTKSPEACQVWIMHNS